MSKKELNELNVVSRFIGDFFDNIKSSWKKDSCSNGKLKICSVKCGTEFDPFGEQFA